MLDVFVLCNQKNEYLSKAREWLAAGDSKTLFRSEHLDDIINEKVELTVKHPDLRIRNVQVQQAQNGRLLVDEIDILPKPSHSATEQAMLDLDDEAASVDPEPCEQIQVIDVNIEQEALTESFSTPATEAN